MSRMRSSFHLTMRSPCRTPTAEPGPVGSTLMTIAPISAIAVELSRLEAEADVPVCDPAMGLQFAGDAFDGRRRNDQSRSSRPEHRHAECVARDVEREAAFAGATQRKIKLDPLVDLAAAQAAPRGANG